MNSSLGVAIRARLVEVRKKAGLSQKQVAERLDPPVTHQSISRWETGKGGSPNPRELTQMVTACGSTMDYVCMGIRSKPDTGSLLVDQVLSAVAAPEKKSRGRGHKDFENSSK